VIGDKSINPLDTKEKEREGGEERNSRSRNPSQLRDFIPWI